MMPQKCASALSIILLFTQFLAIALATVAIGGCSSLMHAGTASYSMKPVLVNDKLVCCEVVIHNGKQIASLDARIEKHGDDYTVDLKQRGVEAFRGQEIAAEAATVGMTAAATAATAIMVAPAVGALGSAAIGAIAQ